MPQTQNNQRLAVRLVEDIDNILALERSWPGRRPVPGSAFTSKFQGPSAPVRDLTEEELKKFDALDAKIGGLMHLLHLRLVPPGVPKQDHVLLRGYTELPLFIDKAINVDDWERRLLALKQIAQEIKHFGGSPISDRGRPKADYKTVRLEDALAAKWVQARQSGVYKAAFAKDKGMSTKDLESLLNRVRKRKARSDK